MGSATGLQGTLNTDGSIRSAALNLGGRGSGVRLPLGEMLPLLLPWGGGPEPLHPPAHRGTRSEPAQSPSRGSVKSCHAKGHGQTQ